MISACIFLAVCQEGTKSGDLEILLYISCDHDGCNFVTIL